MSRWRKVKYPAALCQRLQALGVQRLHTYRKTITVGAVSLRLVVEPSISDDCWCWSAHLHTRLVGQPRKSICIASALPSREKSSVPAAKLDAEAWATVFGWRISTQAQGLKVRDGKV